MHSARCPWACCGSAVVPTADKRCHVSPYCTILTWLHIPACGVKNTVAHLIWACREDPLPWCPQSRSRRRRWAVGTCRVKRVSQKELPWSPAGCGCRPPNALTGVRQPKQILEQQNLDFGTEEPRSGAAPDIYYVALWVKKTKFDSNFVGSTLLNQFGIYITLK